MIKYTIKTFSRSDQTPHLLFISKELIIIKKKDLRSFDSDFDYEEDPYDRLKNISKENNNYKDFTNKVTRKKVEFDYEEDPYEPEK